MAYGRDYARKRSPLAWGSKPVYDEGGREGLRAEIYAAGRRCMEARRRGWIDAHTKAPADPVEKSEGDE